MNLSILLAEESVWIAKLSVWHEHPKAVVVALVILLVQATLIVGLLVNRHWRRKTEASLRISEERYREVVECRTEMVCRYRADTTLTFANEAYCKFFGKRREELLGQRFLSLIPEEQHSYVLETIRRVITERGPVSNEHEVLRPDGSIGWMEWHDFAIFDARGELEELQGIGRDITDRRKAQEALRQSEEKFAGAFRASPTAICILRATDGRLLDVNESWERLFGYARKIVLGRTPLDLGMFASAEDADAFLRVLKDGKVVWEHELQMYRHGGESCWVRVSGDSINAGGEPCYLGIIQDFTERKQIEEARQEVAHATRLALVGELTASIAHEINQPLGAILSNAEAAELLLHSPHPPLGEVKTILADIRKDDLRASEVIRRVRTLLRKRPVEMNVLNLNTLIDEVLRLVKPDAERRGVQVMTELEESLPEVFGDRVQLEQVMLNLLINGMDAMRDTPRGWRRLMIRSRGAGGRDVEISVADHGHGISPEELPRIFESFFTTKPQGMGLGLAMVRSIVELHRGRITAENSADGGAVFRFNLPAYGTPGA